MQNWSEMVRAQVCTSSNRVKAIDSFFGCCNFSVRPKIQFFRRLFRASKVSPRHSNLELARRDGKFKSEWRPSLGLVRLRVTKRAMFFHSSLSWLPHLDFLSEMEPATAGSSRTKHRSRPSLYFLDYEYYFMAEDLKRLEYR